MGTVMARWFIETSLHNSCTSCKNNHGPSPSVSKESIAALQQGATQPADYSIDYMWQKGNTAKGVNESFDISGWLKSFCCIYFQSWYAIYICILSRMWRKRFKLLATRHAWNTTDCMCVRMRDCLHEWGAQHNVQCLFYLHTGAGILHASLNTSQQKWCLNLCYL